MSFDPNVQTCEHTSAPNEPNEIQEEKNTPQNEVKAHPNPGRIRTHDAPAKKPKIIPRRDPPAEIIIETKPEVVARDPTKPRKLDESQLIEEIIINKAQVGKVKEETSLVLRGEKKAQNDVIYNLDSAKFQKVIISENVELSYQNLAEQVVVFNLKDLNL